MRPRAASRRLRPLLTCAVLLALAGGGSAAAEPFDARPLELRMTFSLVTLEGRIIMKLDQSQITESGRAVGATLEQENRLRVDAWFTPVWITDSELTLHVQGQIWVGDAERGYGDAPLTSAYRSIPVALGDYVLFFPLGGEDELRGNTSRFHFRADAFPIDPPQDHEAAGGEGGDEPVAVVIVMAVQVDLHAEDRDGAAERLNVVS